ncbi:MAG: septation protein SpoVG family protein [Oscillospiraceae bacterium]
MKIAISNFTLYEQSPSLRATADVTFLASFGALLTVRDVKLVQGRNNVFMAMPTKKAGEIFEPIVVLEDENVKKKLYEMLIGLYNQSTHNITGGK